MSKAFQQTMNKYLWNKRQFICVKTHGYFSNIKYLKAPLEHLTFNLNSEEHIRTGARLLWFTSEGKNWDQTIQIILGCLVQGEVLIDSIDRLIRGSCTGLLGLMGSGLKNVWGPPTSNQEFLRVQWTQQILKHKTYDIQAESEQIVTFVK